MPATPYVNPPKSACAFLNLCSSWLILLVKQRKSVIVSCDLNTHSTAHMQGDFIIAMYDQLLGPKN